MEKPILQILSELAKIPNVSYYEQEVGNYIYKRLRDFVDKIYFDEFGNLIAHRKGLKDSAPSFAFVSHMDHPGFEVIDSKKSTYTLKTMGGVSKYAGTENNSLILIDEDNKIPITVTKKPEITSEFDLNREKDGWLGNDVIFSTIDYDLGDKNFQVIFDLEDFFIDKKTNLIHMRSADDLAGCSSIMQALINLSNQNIEGDFYGIFTRAEEVGLLGSAALAESEIIPIETNIVSVETSSIIPGANLYDGVIIRNGDRISTFDNSTEKFLIHSANNLQNKKKLKPTEVPSPTFNIVNEYKIGEILINHFDLFKIKDPKELFNIGIFEDSNEKVTLVEWPEIISDNTKKVIKLYFSYYDDFKRRNLEIVSEHRKEIINEFK